MKKISLLLSFLVLGLILTFTACNKKEESAKNVESVSNDESTSMESATNESTNLLDELKVTYKGGLCARSEVNDMMLALFDSSNLPVVIITEFDNLYYGEYTTEEKELADGTKYTSITVEQKTYGYHFNEDGTGILVDQNGNKYEAKQLDESVATDMVRRTVEG